MVIVRFDLKTPGRESAAEASAAATLAPAAGPAAWIAALGGAGNLRSVDACTTRLRLAVKDQTAADADALRQLGARGLVRPSAGTLQVVVGTTADQLAGEIRAALGTVIAQTPCAASAGDPAPLLRALGGGENVCSVNAAASRLRIEIRDAARPDRTALTALGPRGVAFPRADCVHPILGPPAAAMAAALRELLSARRPGRR